MTARLDISHREDKTGLEVQMTQLTGAAGTSALVDTIVGQATGTVMDMLPIATVAAAGSNQATAAALTVGVTTVTGLDGTKGVTLPTAPAAGTWLIVIPTTAAQVCPVYPDPAATINAIAANAAISLAALKPAIFIATSATQWYTIPLLPS